MACKGVCVRDKATHGGGSYTLRYAEGQKRCQVCQIYLIWQTNNYCPCCGNKLRIKPRKGRLKQGVIQFLNIENNRLPL